MFWVFDHLGLITVGICLIKHGVGCTVDVSPLGSNGKVLFLM